MLVFLKLNGISINCTDKDLVTLGLGIADGSINDIDIVTWIEKYENNFK